MDGFPVAEGMQEEKVIPYHVFLQSPPFHKGGSSSRNRCSAGERPNDVGTYETRWTQGVPLGGRCDGGGKVAQGRSVRLLLLLFLLFLSLLQYLLLLSLFLLS